MNNSKLVNYFKDQLEQKISFTGWSIDAAHKKITEEEENFHNGDQQRIDSLNEAFVELKRQQLGIKKATFASIISRKNHEDWYFSSNEEVDLNWFAYKKYLAEIKCWSSEDIDSIDKSSTKVINQLLNPNSKAKRYQGLVLGYVQSGKTSNMAGTIAKAADRGYQLIIILAGLTDSLRKQTQNRMQKDIIQHLEERWYPCTTEESDFTLNTKLLPIFKGERKTTILVIKKNVFILRRLLKKIKLESEVNRKELATLIIDDECDQASLNTKSYREQVSLTNGLIREILQNLNKVTYLGYTATPYANILTSQKSVDGKLDLYPNDFIVSLKEPKNYFGARKLFGDEYNIETNNELPFIRRVKVEEIEYLKPARQKDRFNFKPSLTESLINACDYYLLSLCSRSLRGQKNEHCCMLIHTTIYSETHKDLWSLIKNQWLKPLKDNILKNDLPTINRLKNLWEKESLLLDENLRNQLDCPDKVESFIEIEKCLLDSVDSIKIVIENSTVNTDKRLDFDGGESIHAIVIGGNVLARGLTIEGLVCSYFIRSSSQYDTLMQMGRWFGYRKGYEDLPRIWMTFDLEQKFRDLVNVENLIRSDISVMEEQGYTPRDLSIRVPLIANLNITARNKLNMNKLSECQGSLYGTYKQTISFPVDQEFHKSNYICIENLINKAPEFSKNSFQEKDNSYLLKDVSFQPILKFFRSFKFNEDTLQKVYEFLEKDLNEESSHLKEWNIGIIGSQNSKRPIDIGKLNNVNTVSRSKVKPDDTQLMKKTIYIQGLMGAGDLLIDVEKEKYRKWKNEKEDSSREWDLVRKYREEILGKKPLLLVFPISKDSTPKKKKTKKEFDFAQERLPLFDFGDLDINGYEPHDIFGIGVVFPNVDNFNAQKFLQLDLINIEEDDDAEEIDERELISEDS